MIRIARPSQSATIALTVVRPLTLIRPETASKGTIAAHNRTMTRSASMIIGVVPEDEKVVSPFALGVHVSRFYRCALAGGNFFSCVSPRETIRAIAAELPA